MNERIKQLAGQALDKVVPYTWTRLDYDEIQKLQEYFAQLIVKESIDWLAMNEEDAKALREHFGVKENERED